jgi:alpha-beta hydrolase superfamily lysophospholipase
VHKKNEIREAVTLENEGLQLFGILHKPLVCLSGVLVPCVVMLHGFGGNKSGRFRLITRLAEELAERGIASFRFDCRGSGDSEGDFQDTTLDTLTSDALCALRFIYSKCPGIDTSRLGIYGRSFGAAVALRAASSFHVLHPDTIKTAAVWAPVFDAKPWLAHLGKNSHISPSVKSEGAGSFSFLGQPLNDQFVAQFAAYKAEQTLRSLDNLSLLVIHGSLDTTTDGYHAGQYRVCRSHNPDTKIIELTHTDHEFSNIEEQQTALNETIDWYLNHLV